MHLQLADLIRDLESAEERVRQLDASLPSHAWSARPAQERWSAAECVAHLNLTSEALLPLIRRAIRDARDRPEPAPRRYRRNALGWLAWKIVSPEGGMKTRSIAAIAPATSRPIDDLLKDFIRLQGEVMACVREADGLPLEHVKVQSPFHGRMTYNLYAALTLVPRHQHRHLRQAEEAARSYAPLAAMAAV